MKLKTISDFFGLTPSDSDSMGIRSSLLTEESAGISDEVFSITVVPFDLTGIVSDEFLIMNKTESISRKITKAVSIYKTDNFFKIKLL